MSGQYLRRDQERTEADFAAVRKALEIALPKVGRVVAPGDRFVFHDALDALDQIARRMGMDQAPRGSANDAKGDDARDHVDELLNSASEAVAALLKQQMTNALEVGSGGLIIEPQASRSIHELSLALVSLRNAFVSGSPSAGKDERA